MSDPDQIVRDARPLAIDLARKVAAAANARPEKDAGIFGVCCAGLVLQNTLTSIALDLHAPGSLSGEEFLRVAYTAILDDAVRRWHKADLKERFGPGGTHHRG